MNKINRIYIGYPPFESDRGVALLSQNRQFQWFKSPTYIYPVVPATAATMIKNAGYNVDFIDAVARNMTTKQWHQYLEANTPDLLFFEVKTPVIYKAWKIVDDLKKKYHNMIVVIAGDISWAMTLNEAIPDLQFLSTLRGHKIIIKGNHDYWWGTLSKMNEFLKENNIENIKFLYNNSYLVENKIIVGSRGWNTLDVDDNSKMIKRENARLELSINDGLSKYGADKEIIAFMHYPPINKGELLNGIKTQFVKTLEKYNVDSCYYGHLHGTSHKDAVEGKIQEIKYKLISADYLKFDLEKIN